MMEGLTEVITHLVYISNNLPQFGLPFWCQQVEIPPGFRGGIKYEVGVQTGRDGERGYNTGVPLTLVEAQASANGADAVEPGNLDVVDQIEHPLSRLDIGGRTS